MFLKSLNFSPIAIFSKYFRLSPFKSVITIQSGVSWLSIKCVGKSYANKLTNEKSRALDGYHTIDLYLSGDVDGQALYSRFIASIQVLAVRDKDGKDVFIDRDNMGDPEVMSFAVPEYLYLLLISGEIKVNSNEVNIVIEKREFSKYSITNMIYKHCNNCNYF